MNEFERELDALAKANLRDWGYDFAGKRVSGSGEQSLPGETKPANRMARPNNDPFAWDNDPRIRGRRSNVGSSRKPEGLENGGK